MCIVHSQGFQRCFSGNFGKQTGQVDRFQHGCDWSKSDQRSTRKAIVSGTGWVLCGVLNVIWLGIPSYLQAVISGTILINCQICWYHSFRQTHVMVLISSYLRWWWWWCLELVELLTNLGLGVLNFTTTGSFHKFCVASGGFPWGLFTDVFHWMHPAHIHSDCATVHCMIVSWLYNYRLHIQYYNFGLLGSFEKWLSDYPKSTDYMVIIMFS